MKILKFFIAAALLLSLTITCFAGCDGLSSGESEEKQESAEKASFTVPEGFDTSKQHEISFWAKNDTNLTQVEIYKKAVADFEALYPNVKVKLKLYTDYGRIYQDVITNIATKTTPDVCITYPDHIATYLTGNDIVVPLDDLMADEKYGLGGSELEFDSPKKDEIVEKFLLEGKIEGVQYALPFMRSTEACYVNKTYVEKLGFTLPETLTWEFMWQVAEAATAKDENGNYKVNGQKTLIPVIYKSTDNMMIQMLRQKGAGYSNESGEVLLFNDVTESLLLDIAKHAESGAFSTFKISSYPANFLNAGQCIFAIDSTAGATWMGANAPLVDIPEESMVDFETVVMTIPQFDPENPVMISQGPSLCVFNKDDPQRVMASWLFTQFLLTNDVQIAYSQTEGYAPVTDKAQKSAEYTDYLSREGEDNQLYYDIKLKATKLLIENTDKTFVTPVFNGSASLRNAAGQLIEEVTKAVRRNKKVDNAFIEDLYVRMQSLYHLENIGEDAGEIKQEFGALPTESVALIVTLGAVWVGIGCYVIIDWAKKRKKQKNI